MGTKGGCYGAFSVTTLDKKGNRYRYDSPNVITFDMSRSLSHLLVGDSAANFAATFLAIGSGNTLAPVRADTQLENEIVQLPFDSIVFLNGDTRTEINVLLDFVSPTNGSTLAEAGLVGGDGVTLLTRQLHVPIVKDEDHQVEYKWIIHFT